MSGWNRALALAGCTLIAAACSQDTTTAPPAAAEVAPLGGELPTTYGTEYGTITFTSVRGDETVCNVKMALKNLYIDWDDPDLYYLYIGTAASPQLEDTDWQRQIVNSEISRATLRGEGTSYVPKTLMQPAQSCSSAGSACLYLGLAYWGTNIYGQTPLYLNDFQIGYFTIGGFANTNTSVWKIVNRCF